MSNICAKSDGSNGLIYNISYDDIQSIFKTYPEVKVKYIQNVPNKMTELEFWDKFFQVCVLFIYLFYFPFQFG